MDFRQYDPSTGRFYTIDLLAEATYSVTPYHFAGNNPVIGSDPTGLLTFYNGIDHSQPQMIQGGQNGYGMINRFGNTQDSFLDNLHSGYGLDPSGGGAFPGSTPYGLGTGYSGGYQGHLDYAEGGHWLYVGKQNTVTITGYNTMNNGVPGYYADIKVDNRDYHVWQPTGSGNGVSFFGDIFKGTEKHFNGSVGTIGVAVQGYNEISNDVKRLYAHKLSRLTGIRSGKIFQGVKNFANSTGKLVSKLGPVGTVLGIGVIAYELKTGTWDAHTAVNAGLMIGAGIATFFAAPAVLTGIAIYGVVDYFFDTSAIIDNNIGRKSGLWEQ